MTLGKRVFAPHEAQILFEPFFLPVSPGMRFCIFHPAVESTDEAILYVQPFAEEMNKSRRMAALQSRKFAADGISVLQMDLLGCGDSSGQFADARWESWKEDLAFGVKWLQNRGYRAIHLWGLRLGALLALDYARDIGTGLSSVLIWQPVLNGEQFLTQFLRLRVAGELLGGGSVSTGTKLLRNELAAGHVLEIGGYALAPALALAIDQVNLADLAPVSSKVYWFEIVSAPGRALTPAGQRVADGWRSKGVDLDVACIPGLPFWNTQEISDCPALISATANSLRADHNAF